MKIVFFGNTNHSIIVAEAIFQELGLSAVVTIPNSPVKTFGEQNNIPVVITNILDNETIKKIAAFSSDFLVVADYGLLLPKTLLDLPKYAPLNVHHSLLPKYRGPSPAPTVILNGDKVSGVTIIRMNQKLDAGDIVAQKKYTLKPDETTDSILTKLNQIGGEIIIPVISDYIANKAKQIPQKNKEATFTTRFEKKDGFFDLDNPPAPQQLNRMIRAYYPWPGVWSRTTINNKSSIIKFLPNQKIQVEGKKPMSYKDFINGYPEAKQLLERLLEETL